MIASMDARLRPDGEKGALVAPLAAYESYYRDRAQLWEIQALTRARPITGPSQAAYLDSIRTIWRKVGQQSDLFAKIDGMLERIHRERGSGNGFLDFKTGIGGMIEAEFLVQALQMRAGIWEPNFESAVAGLVDNSVMSNSDGPRATESYNFLRGIEMALRRFENKNVAGLPPTPEEQAKLSKWLGYKVEDTFVSEYHAVREAIHALYDRYVKSQIN